MLISVSAGWPKSKSRVDGVSSIAGMYTGDVATGGIAARWKVGMGGMVVEG